MYLKPAQWLTDEIVISAQDILSQQFPEVSVFQSPIYEQKLQRFQTQLDSTHSI